MELGIDSLLRAREQDPYFDPATRLLYERLRGEPAPTFAAPVLDAAIVRAKMSRDGKRRRQSRHNSAGMQQSDSEGRQEGGASEAQGEVDKEPVGKVVA